MTTAAPLEITGLAKAFDGVAAVDGVDLALRSGELLALVGPSGCGKSTLLRTIAGLVAADAGTIRLGGLLVEDGRTRLPPERRSIGLVFQEHALFPHLTVRANIGFGLRDMSRRDVAARVEEMLALVSLDGHGDRFPHELSGGERQRVALARALGPAPALMLFDEPFASIDHNLRVQLRRDVSAALRATQTPAVFVTHDQSEALAIGDRIAVMHAGRLVQVDSPDAVFHAPVDTFVARFMGDASFLDIDLGAGSPRTALGPIDADPADVNGYAAMVRPDDVVVIADDHGDSEILTAEYHGTGWLGSARLHDGSVVIVTSSHLDPLVVGRRGRLALVEGHRQVLVRRADG